MKNILTDITFTIVGCLIVIFIFYVIYEPESHRLQQENEKQLKCHFACVDDPVVSCFDDRAVCAGGDDTYVLMIKK